MSSRAIKIAELQNFISSLDKQKQSPEREKEKAIAKFELAYWEGKRDSERASVALMLFNAYFDSGSMRVMLPDGRTMEGKPTRTESLIYDIWNVRAEAELLAMRAKP